MFTHTRLSLLLVAVLGSSLPGSAFALAEDASIDIVTAGHVDSLDLGNLVIEANRMTLPAPSPSCLSTTMWRGRTFCAKYDDPAPLTTNTDVVGDIAASDNDRYVVDPSTGYAAMRVELGISLLKSEVNRIDISAEVAQSHAGQPIQALIFNHDTGRYEHAGSIAGSSDAFLRHTILGNASAYVSGTSSLTMLLINVDRGINAGTLRLNDSMYVDYVNISVDNSVVPEPGAAVLTTLGLLGLTVASRRRA
jgi:hypothetical protein